MDYKQLKKDLLSLNDAAHRLGVHFTTLRRWADEGKIGTVITPGGHRRFHVNDIDRFIEEKKNRFVKYDVSEVYEESAMAHTRHEIEAHGKDKGWMQKFSKEDMEQQRLMGRRLFGVMLQYISVPDDGEDFLEEAKQIGKIYALEMKQKEMPLSEVLQAAMFFKDALVEAALQLPQTAQVRADTNNRLLRRMNDVLNAVQLSIVEGYESLR